MKILVTICARAGSKRIKNKNLRYLAGKPLIEHTIDIAKKWNKANRIICSTDSDQIASIAKAKGISVPFIRPSHLASDTSGKLPVVRHALKESELRYGEKYDLVVDLDVTSPIRKLADLDACLQVLLRKNAEVVFSVTKARRNPYFNMVEINSDGFAMKSKKTEDPILRSQDAPLVYDMNASIYFFKRQFLLDEQNGYVLDSKRSAVYAMDDLSAFDIDNEIDLKFVEFLIKNNMVEQ